MSPASIFGFVNDANAMVVVASVGARAEEFGVPADAFYVPFVAEEFRLPYARWVERVVEVAQAFRLRKTVAEMNGCGIMPSQEFAQRLGYRVEGVHTDSRPKKRNSFARIKLMLEQRRLVLPRHPSLLMQLSSLEFEVLDAGLTKIAAPDPAGHDDVAMSMALAVRGDPKLGMVRTVTGPRVAPGPTRQPRHGSASARSTRGGDFEVTFGDGSRKRVPARDWRVRAAERIIRGR